MKIYKLSPQDDKGLLRISLVKEPAIQTQLMAFSKETEVFQKFLNEDKMEFYAPALIPDKLIFRKSINGEPAHVFFNAETIKSLHLNGAKNQYDSRINLNHEDINTDGLYCFESWIVEDSKIDKAFKLGFDVPNGTLMKAYKVEDNDLWQKIKNGELTGLSIEAYLDHGNESTVNLNKQRMNKKTIFDYIKSLFAVDGSTEYATGFFGTSLDLGAIITDADGNTLPNAEFEFEGNKYKTDDMGAISEVEPIEVELADAPVDAPVTDTTEVDKLNTRILELETENASLKAELTKATETQMEKETEITKLQEEVVEAKKISNLPKEVAKSYDQMTNYEKMKYNEERSRR